MPRWELSRLKSRRREASCDRRAERIFLKNATTNSVPSVSPRTMLGSPANEVLYDFGLQSEQKVDYRVRAVDAWDNQSPACAAVRVMPGMTSDR